MIFFAGLFNSLLTEVPRLWDNVQQNATMLNMLSQMQQDIDKAIALPQSQGQFVSNSQLLLIEQKDALIGYEIVNEQVVRRILNITQTDTAEPRIWLLPDAKIQWIVLKNNGNAYAVEVRNHIEYQKGRRLENKMANSHLYFIGAL